MDEQIVVVRRSDFFGGDWPQGFVAREAAELAALHRAFLAAAFAVPRGVAEKEPLWKQLVPYCVLTRGESVFAVQRRQAQGEARLHGSWSIGLGGHMDAQDLDAADPVSAAVARELAEELDVQDAEAPVPLGLINDDSNEVGRVHVGLVHHVRVRAGGDVLVREIHKMAGGFVALPGQPRRGHGPVVTPDSLWQDPGRFETWSRLLLPAVTRMGIRADHGSNSTPSREEASHG